MWLIAWTSGVTSPVSAVASPGPGSYTYKLPALPALTKTASSPTVTDDVIDQSNELGVKLLTVTETLASLKTPLPGGSALISIQVCPDPCRSEHVGFPATGVGTTCVAPAVPAAKVAARARRAATPSRPSRCNGLYLSSDFISFPSGWVCDA